MVYTDDVRKKLDAILKAFGNYIDGQNYFDIVYSKKISYVWIVVDDPGSAGAEPLDTPEIMLDNLFNDIINDVVALRKSTSIKETHTLTESEESECRRRITPILKQIEGGGLSIWNTWMSISSNSPLLLRRKALWLSPPPVGR